MMIKTSQVITVYVVTCGLIALAAALLSQCSTSNVSEVQAKAMPADSPGLAAWDVVYRVLQHPRCLNCHPRGDRPLQGDASLAHQQNVMRGEDGHGVFAMRCQTCHQEKNLAGEHLPPGGPDWHLPPKSMRLVFEGQSSGDLCRQMRDFDTNDHHTMAEILDHIEHAPLVLWGWDPGNGRSVPPISHAELVQAARTWIDGGCDCPK